MASGPGVWQAGAVPQAYRPRRPVRAPWPGTVGRRDRFRLPVGRELAADDFAWRHRFVCGVLAVHVVALVVLAVLRGEGAARGGILAAPVALLLAVALLPLRRRLRTGAATIALLCCSAGLVHLFDGAPELRYHYFVAVAVIALYQDWTTYALAVVFVAVQHGLAPAGGADTDWDRALLHAGFVLAESAVLVLFWYANDRARADSDRMRDALQQGQNSVAARLAETDRIRHDLIGTVSHEFRTPLTGIRAAALTLLKRGERLDAAGRARLLHSVLDQQERLSRLLENMLTAAQANATDPTACAEVDAVAAEVAMLAGAARPEQPAVSVLVDPGTTARIDRQALHQVLANLVDNAHQHGAVGAVPLVAGARDDHGIWLTVSNEGTTLDTETARTLFEPFTQLDSGPTRAREGLGMGLYVVRRLVEVYGGSVALRSEGGWTTVELRLPAMDDAGQPPAPPISKPTPKVTAAAAPPSST